MAEARAIQRTTRQSPYKMRLVIDQIRGLPVNEALAILTFSKKHAAVQIRKVLQSAVANAEFRAREQNEPLDVDEMYVKHAIVNEGPKLKRFTPAAMGRATPIQKRTSHVEIIVAEKEGRYWDRKSIRSASASASRRSGGRSGMRTATSRRCARKTSYSGST